MKKGKTAGILLIGAIASLYLIGKGGALGGAGAEKVGAILGSPGGLTAESFASTGVSAAKLAPAAMGPTTVTPLVKAGMPKKEGAYPIKLGMPGFEKEEYVKRAYGTTYIPEAATQAYITQAGGYVAPTFTGGVGGKIIGGRYTPPTGLYPSKTQAGLTAKGLATQKKVTARSTGRAPSSTKLTSKGAAVKKRVAARQARSG